MDLKPLFKGPSLVLTAPRPEDAAVMATWTTDDQYLRLVDTDIARPMAVSAIAQHAAPEYEFRLRRIGDDALVGFVALMGIEWGNRTAKMAIGIGEARFRGMGYGTEAIHLILHYAFEELNLHRVGLDVIEYNEPAVRLYQKMEFQVEGRRRQAVWRQGQRFDLIDMGILEPEWAQRSQERVR